MNEPWNTPETITAAASVRAWAFSRYKGEMARAAPAGPLRIERPARVTGPDNLKSVDRMTGRCPSGKARKP